MSGFVFFDRLLFGGLAGGGFLFESGFDSFEFRFMPGGFLSGLFLGSLFDGKFQMELEKYRVASSAFPKQELRCIDLRPFNCTEQEIAFLSQFKGFYRPRQQVADTAYEKLYAWLGNPSYRPRCFLVPYRKNTE